MGLTPIAKAVALLALCLAAFIPLHSFGQLSMGDTPCDAVVVNPVAQCQTPDPTNQYVSDNTYTDYLGGPTCNGVEKPVDGWIAFTATSTQTSIFWSEVTANTNSVLYLYEEVAPGACPGT